MTSTRPVTLPDYLWRSLAQYRAQRRLSSDHAAIAEVLDDALGHNKPFDEAWEWESDGGDCEGYGSEQYWNVRAAWISHGRPDAKRFVSKAVRG